MNQHWRNVWLRKVLCFDVYERGKLAVVLLKTKTLTMKNITQTIGYFIKSFSSSVKPPVCFVLTEQTLNVILFPFLDSSSKLSLINAVLLKPVCFCDNINGILYLLGILTHKHLKCLFPFH